MELTIMNILLLGSPAFGLEALIIGLGGRISSLYDEKIKFIPLLLITGLGIVETSLIISIFLNPSILFTCAITLILTLIVGKSISTISKKIVDKKEITTPNSVTEKNMKSMLKNVGLSELADKKEEKDKKSENQN